MGEESHGLDRNPVVVEVHKRVERVLRAGQNDVAKDQKNRQCHIGQQVDTSAALGRRAERGGRKVSCQWAGGGDGGSRDEGHGRRDAGQGQRLATVGELGRVEHVCRICPDRGKR